jgi:hypothetical protein
MDAPASNCWFAFLTVPLITDCAIAPDVRKMQKTNTVVNLMFRVILFIKYCLIKKGYVIRIKRIKYFLLPAINGMEAVVA